MGQSMTRTLSGEEDDVPRAPEIVRPPHIGDQGDADGSNAHHGHTAQPISIPGRKNSTESSEGMMAYIGSPPSTTAAWDTSLPSQFDDRENIDTNNTSHNTHPTDSPNNPGTTTKPGSKHNSGSGCVVQVVFTWSAPANEVKVSGSFNQWGDPIVLTKNKDGGFVASLALEPGRHEYKFIVDAVWHHDPKQPITQNAFGSVNNILHVGSQHDKGTCMGLDADADAARTRKAPRAHKRQHSGFQFDADVTLETLHNFGRNTPPGEYATEMPDFSEAKSPPGLPPQLLQATLNSEPLGNDPSQLPEPNHVLLDHLYALSVKDNVMVLGTTDRFKKKFVTTVLYKPILPS